MSERARHRSRQLPPSLLAGWKAQPISLRLLRGFLGVTFVYAGIQKLADPTFFQSGSPTYIGSQLQGFSRGSPIGPLLSLLDKAPTLAGVGVALTEIAIGAATLLGIGMMLAAAGGFGLSTMLWLSASWHVHPYFLGSDSIYAVAWLALLLGVWEMNRRKSQARGKGKGRVAEAPLDLSRRQLIRGGALSLVTLAVGGVAFASAGKAPAVKGFAASSTPRPVRSPKIGPSSAPSSSAASAVAPSPTATHTHAPRPAPAGTQIATLDSLNVGQAVGFNAPGVGACALVRTSGTQCEAYSRTCTHMGCEVGWDQTSGLLVCPCHGAQFDPAQGGKPVAGPAFRPLQQVKVVVDRQTGQVLLPQ